MRIPAIRGVIDRRVLVNYRVDPEVMARQLPAPFRPKLAQGFAIGGICLIRLKGIRPRALPLPFGIRSENAAHRIAVEWNDGGRPRAGVFIPRRDTSSAINAFAGGRLFPGEHHHARFDVEENANRLRIAMTSDDGLARVRVDAMLATALSPSSIFPSLADASEFFEGGSVGYSVTSDPSRLDGLELRCRTWTVQPLTVSDVESSYFDDRERFPEGSVEFDCALLMRGIEHEWHGRAALCCSPVAEAAAV